LVYIKAFQGTVLRILLKRHKKQYFRLSVTNRGGVARSLKVSVDILDKDRKELKRFEPSTLRWINGKESIDLARGSQNLLTFSLRFQNLFTKSIIGFLLKFSMLDLVV